MAHPWSPLWIKGFLLDFMNDFFLSLLKLTVTGNKELLKAVHGDDKDVLRMNSCSIDSFAIHNKSQLAPG